MKLCTRVMYAEENSTSVRDYVNHLRNQGFKKLGSGAYADVYGRQGTNYVVKVCGNFEDLHPDLGYSMFVQQVVEMQRKRTLSAHLPRIYGVVHVGKTITPDIFQVLDDYEKENRLFKKAKREFMNQHKDLNYSLYYNIAEKKFKKPRVPALIRDIVNYLPRVGTFKKVLARKNKVLDLPDNFLTKYSVYIIERLENRKRTYDFYDTPQQVNPFLKRFIKRTLNDSKNKHQYIVAQVMSNLYAYRFVSTDLHGGNVMIRPSDQSFVITDPVVVV